MHLLSSHQWIDLYEVWFSLADVIDCAQLYCNQFSGFNCNQSINQKGLK